MWENEQEAIVKIRLPRKHQALADVVSLTENGLTPKSVTWLLARRPEELLLFQLDRPLETRKYLSCYRCGLSRWISLYCAKPNI